MYTYKLYHEVDVLFYKNKYKVRDTMYRQTLLNIILQYITSEKKKKKTIDLYHIYMYKIIFIHET